MAFERDEMTFDPRKIPNNFRLQTLIDQELVKANTLIATGKNDLSATDLVNLALIYSEMALWNKVETDTTRALAAKEEAPTSPSTNENKATALYALGTRKRELNFCTKALVDLSLAQSLAESTWLKSNLLRNIGLVYLKLQRFEEATPYFEETLTLAASDEALRGSLPALSHYVALAKALMN